VKPFFTRRRIIAAVVVAVLLLFLVRPGVSRLKVRIVNSISRALARPVEIGSVHLRFLPRPGFDLENLIIHEDPAFGAESMLRAPEVTAVVRLTSLARGRLDISRLELTEPSLNLVRREDGRWNWESLLERTARNPLAPTAKSKSEARAGFPYIEASSGRVNFKAGAEKKPYALLNADFALWQESENAWGVRLKAEPLRADMSLSDTGLLRMNGTWQRAGSLRETPLRFDLQWQHAQLGQFSKLISGSDKGWRGEVELEAALSGTPAAMQMTGDAAVHDFHRYDISTSEELSLAAHCDGRYSSADGMLREIFCTAPVGNGMITLKGSAGRPIALNPDLLLDMSMNLDNVPVSAVAQLARRMKKDLPADLVATGNVHGNFSVKEDGEPWRRPKFEGSGEFANLQLQSALNRVEVAASSVPFVLSAERNHPLPESKSYNSPLRKDIVRPDAGTPVAPAASDELHLEYGPFPVALGRAAPAQARGWIGRYGYALTLRGDAEVAHTLRMASLLGLPALKANAEGAAQLDLQISGSWAENVAGNPAGFSLPKVDGTVQLRNVHAIVRGINGPIEIASAELKLLSGEALIEKLNARAADARWTGSVQLPRGCGNPTACIVHFDLSTDTLSLSNLHEWLGTQPSQRKWYQVLTSTAEPGAPSFLQNLRASGRVEAERLSIHDFDADRVSAALELDRGKMKVSNLRADVFGGKHRGDWQVDFTGVTPRYTGAGTLKEISLDQVASAMHDPWISGTGEGTYRFSASGKDSATFWHSAEGVLSFDLRNGMLAHIALASEGPLQISRWEGHLRVHDGNIDIQKNDIQKDDIAKDELSTSAGKFEISGTASLGRVLNIKLTSFRSKSAQHSEEGSAPVAYSITGPLAEPRVTVTPAPETQANLKP
jgi:uncharacterized protein involved in outer membrane biogenesis